MTNNFYAILDDGEFTVARVDLQNDLVAGIQKILIKNGENLIGDDIEETEFDENYKPQEDEVLYVDMPKLPKNVSAIATKALSIGTLDLNEHTIKALFWYERKTGVYYFQNFDNRKLLDHKFVLWQSDNTFNRLNENALVIEEKVNAVYRDDKFLFLSEVNANKIFPLTDYFKAATEEDIRSFATETTISLPTDWLVKKANTAVKKQIMQVINSGILKTYNTKLLQSTAAGQGLTLELDKGGKIVFPENLKVVREILSFLNESRFRGPITDTPYETNSKRKLKLP